MKTEVRRTSKPRGCSGGSRIRSPRQTAGLRGKQLAHPAVAHADRRLREPGPFSAEEASHQREHFVNYRDVYPLCCA